MGNPNEDEIKLSKGEVKAFFDAYIIEYVKKVLPDIITPKVKDAHENGSVKDKTLILIAGGEAAVIKIKTADAIRFMQKIEAGFLSKVPEEGITPAKLSGDIHDMVKIIKKRDGETLGLDEKEARPLTDKDKKGYKLTDEDLDKIADKIKAGLRDYKKAKGFTVNYQRNAAEINNIPEDDIKNCLVDNSIRVGGELSVPVAGLGESMSQKNKVLS